MRYSPYLFDKLGIKAGERVALPGVADGTLRAELEKIAAARAALEKNGALWLIRPKGS